MPEVQISDELERRRRNLPEDGNNEGIQAQVQIVGQVAAKQTKKEGVRYPDRLNSKYRSEIRPAGWKQKKIWLGSFESEDETMRAYDAALHAIGKVPVHYAYPPGHHKPIFGNWKDQELVLKHVKSMEDSHFDVDAFKKKVTANAKCASKSCAQFPLVKDVVDLVLCDLPGPSPGAMDWMVPLCEEIDSEVVGEKALVLRIEMVSEDDSAMPLHQQLPGIHSSIVAPEENIMADGAHLFDWSSVLVGNRGGALRRRWVTPKGLKVRSLYYEDVWTRSSCCHVVWNICYLLIEEEQLPILWILLPCLAVLKHVWLKEKITWDVLTSVGWFSRVGSNLLLFFERTSG